MQGLAFNCIIDCADNQKPWSFENLHVVFYRVKGNEGIRYSPLTKAFNPCALKNELTSTWTTR